MCYSSKDNTVQMRYSVAASLMSMYMRFGTGREQGNGRRARLRTMYSRASGSPMSPAAPHSAGDSTTAHRGQMSRTRRKPWYAAQKRRSESRREFIPFSSPAKRRKTCARTDDEGRKKISCFSSSVSTSSISFGNWGSEVLQIHMDEDGVRCSSAGNIHTQKEMTFSKREVARETRTSARRIA